jgi:hypothetical protein
MTDSATTLKQPASNTIIQIDDDRVWNVRLVSLGDRYGLNNCMTYDSLVPVVEFYDANYAGDTFGQLGQFVSRYYITTFMEIDGSGLNLDDGIHEWQIDHISVNQIQQWINSQPWWLTLPEDLPCEYAQQWPTLSPQERQDLCWKHRPVKARRF